MLGYGSQSIDDSDIAAVMAILRGQPLTCGPAIEAFEGAICAISGAEHAIAVSNGTSALRLMYQAAGIGPGVRVGVPAITFVATATQALLLGAEVVLLDVDPDTLLLTPGILRACRERLDIIVPVHAAGRLCDLAGLQAIAAERGAFLLEDAAHAFGSTWNDGRRCGDGAWSRAAIFSFHPVKNITTGEGGAIVTNDAAFAARCRQLRHHGIVRGDFLGDLAAIDGGAPWYHEFHQPATNERMSDILAALGTSQCRRLPAFKLAREAVLARYGEALSDLTWLRLPPFALGQQPFWHLCAVQIDWARLGIDRRACFASASRAGVSLQVHYIPLHHQPALAGCARGSDLVGADAAYAGLVSLPCHAALEPSDQDRVIAWLRSLAQSVRSTLRQGGT